MGNLIEAFLYRDDGFPETTLRVMVYRMAKTDDGKPSSTKPAVVFTVSAEAPVNPIPR